ncbi:acetaldehyde dehydrogenase (acetylating) [Clostridium tetani]|uniref:acetaldehyde dehydrogenase (acetylating) n=1 Tax=Clostridium tetani TaxID=1513 RepID=UPI0003C0D1B9|nr:acetaldehyde dehydrogenase (acetylating) [Clostridium tetani]CDI49591.1 acetaldehyde dehydrogenase (acetylating) [Clostridium tetani 12124569]
MEKYDKDLYSIQQARNLARLGKVAANKIANYTEEQIDKILRNMVRVAEENAVSLAQMAVEETGFGKVEDKTYKNHLAATILYNSIKDMKTIGVISEDKVNKMIEIAEPVGLIMGIVPSTNPTSTAIFKSIIAIKSRNAIVFSPHPAAAKCTIRAVELMRDAAIEAGAPEDIIASLTNLTMEATNELMKNENVSLIIATGGPGMVKAAYSSGKPAIGVGAGNSPAYIERTANVEKAIRDIISSKSFDYGTICASEQSIICEECNHDAVVEELKKQGGYFMTAEETERVCKLLFKNGHTMNAKFVGRSPQVIANAAGFTVSEDIKVLIGKQNGVGNGNPLSFEKLTTVLAFYTVKDWHEACELSIELLQNGIGHTMSIHTQNDDIVMEFAKKPASRILVNTGGSQGGTGASTGLKPAFTLGCGTWGGSSVSENVTPEYLINKKRVAYGLKDCATLVQNDPTFNCIKTASNCRGVQNQFMNMSPAQIAAAAEVLNKCNDYAKNTGCSNESKEKDANNEELLSLVNQIVAAMKGAN